jgi:uncharacterized protein (TIRG00374 family)
MASLFTARLFKRGLELFAIASILALVALLIYGNSWRASVEAVEHLKPGWVLVALALASSDWWGGGIRIWLLAKFLHREAPLGGMIVAGGLNTWGSYLTPSQTGGGPVMIWAMRRYGVPVPEATIAAFMSFVGTVVFFAITGPLAIVLGAGRSLREHGVPLVHLTLYDVFKASAWGWVVVGALLLFVLVFPARARWVVHALMSVVERWGSPRIATWVTGLRGGIDRMQECVVKFLTPAGWLSMLACVLTSSLAHANKLLAAWVVLRALGIQANMMDVLLVQITIAFLLYFAPTPGGAGAAEALAAALMRTYVPRALLPVYTLMWRFTVSYATVIFGSFVFFRLLHGRLEESPAPAQGAAAT